MSVENKNKCDDNAKKDAFYDDIRKVIKRNKKDNLYRQTNHRVFQPPPFENSEVKTKTYKDKLIHNKLFSQSVFVGTNNSDGQRKDNKNYLLL